MTTPQIKIGVKLLTKSLFYLLLPAPQLHFREDWRRGRDSNPRWPLSQSGFQDRRDRPLCHLSDDKLAAPALASLSEGWHRRGGSNPQPTVLETATLPIELLPFTPNLRTKRETEDSKS